MGIAFVPMLMLALLVLGGVAAVVYVIVRAIANKKPSTAWTLMLVSLGLLLGISLLGVVSSVFVPALHKWKNSTVNTAGSEAWTQFPATGGAPMHLPATNDGWAEIPGAAAQVIVTHGGPSMLLIITVIALIIVAVVMTVKRMSDPNSRRGGRLVWIAALLLAVGLSLRLLGGHQQVVVQQGTEHPMAAVPSMEEMWSRMNQPRIELPPGASSPPDRPSPPSPSPLPVEISPETARLLADVVIQIDALARRVAVIAKQLAEAHVGTGGKTLLQPPPAETAATAAAAESAAGGGTTSAQTRPVGAGGAAVETIAASGELAEPRPDWVDEPPKRIGNVWREVIVAGEYATVEECYRAADVYLLFAAYDHLMQLIGVPQTSDQTRPSLLFQDDNVWAGDQYVIVNGRPTDYRLTRLAWAGIGIDFIRREIAIREHVETVQRSFGPMKKLYTLVEFSPAVDRELRSGWDSYRRQERLAMVGVTAGSLIGLVGLAYGLLKVDTWTKGYYTKRLFLGVPAAIIALLTLLVAMS